MIRFVIIITLIIQGQTALATSCRDAVVEAYDALGGTIARDSFSSYKFSDLNITIDEFNALRPFEQESIYMQIKPIKLMVSETLGLLNQKISDAAGTYYEFFMADKLELMRHSRKTLRTCEYLD